MKVDPDHIEPPTWKEQGYFPSRFFFAFMAFSGMLFTFMLRININFTLLSMVMERNDTNDSLSNPCNFEELEDEAYNGEYDWDEFVQSMISSSFFWGYIWTQIPGGRMGDVYGGRKVFGGAIMGSALLTLFIPWAADQNPTALIVIRVLMGLSQGPIFPTTHALLAAWAPPLERSIISTIVFAGSQAGTIFTYPLCAAIINGLGWRAVFYIQGCMALVWCFCWFYFIPEKPEDLSWITECEKEYLIKSLRKPKEKKTYAVPYKAIALSLPFWAIMISEFCNNWGFWCIMTELPLFLKEMLKKDLNSTAWLSGLPYLSFWIFSLIFSVIGDKLRQNGKISTVALRKVATVIAHTGPAICLLSLHFVDCNRELTVALLFLSVTFEGSMYSGFLVNHLDIAPNFAGTLYGVTNGFAAIPGFLAPMSAGALTNNNQTFSAWQKVFDFAAGLYIFDSIFFVLFASGVEQKWNEGAKKEDKNEIEINSQANEGFEGEKDR